MGREAATYEEIRCRGIVLRGSVHHHRKYSAVRDYPTGKHNFDFWSAGQLPQILTLTRRTRVVSTAHKLEPLGQSVNHSWPS